MNTLMLALLEDRLQRSAAQLQRRLQRPASEPWSDDPVAGELSEVLQALEAVELGRYGRCRECDRSLEMDELLSQPHRLVCADCEGRHRGAVRQLFSHLSERSKTSTH